MSESVPISVSTAIAEGPVVKPDLAAELFGAVNKRSGATEQSVNDGPSVSENFADRYSGWESLVAQDGWDVGPMEKMQAQIIRQQELQAIIDATAGLGMNENELRKFDERMVDNEEHPDVGANGRAKRRWRKNRADVVSAMGVDNFTQDTLGENLEINGTTKTKFAWLKEGKVAAVKMAEIRGKSQYLSKDLLDKLDGDFGLLAVAERNQQLMQAMEKKLAENMKTAVINLMSATDRGAFVESLAEEYGYLQELRVHGVDLTKRVADLSKKELVGMGEKPLSLVEEYTTAQLERIGDGGEVAMQEEKDILDPVKAEARFAGVLQEIKDHGVAGMSVNVTANMEEGLRKRLGFVKKEGNWELSDKSILANVMISEARSADVREGMEATLRKLDSNPELFDRAYYLLQHGVLVDELQTLSGVGVASEVLDVVGDEALQLLKVAGLDEQFSKLDKQLRQLRGSKEILEARAKMQSTVSGMLEKVGISLKGVDYKKGLKYAAIGVGILALLSLIMGVTVASSVMSGLGGGR